MKRGFLSRSDIRKLARHEVPGCGDKWNRPERTVASGVLSGRVVFAAAYQPLRSWLISGGRSATGAVGRGTEVKARRSPTERTAARRFLPKSGHFDPNHPVQHPCWSRTASLLGGHTTLAGREPHPCWLKAAPMVRGLSKGKVQARHPCLSPTASLPRGRSTLAGLEQHPCWAGTARMRCKPGTHAGRLPHPCLP